jgi:hypothetical protein
MSVSKALEHSAMHCKKKLDLIWVESSHLEDEHKETNPAEYYKAWHSVSTANGILVPVGFLRIYFMNDSNIMFRAVSASVVPRVWSRVPNGPVRTMFLTWVFAWVCKWP